MTDTARQTREKTVDTKTRIVDAAERLFAERGFEGTSLRAVTSEAEVNLAAVNYHFGSKEALFREVVRWIREPVNLEQLRRLDELEVEENQVGEAPSVEDLIEAYISPLINLLEGDEERGLVISRLVSRLMSDAGGSVQKNAITEIEEAEDRYLRAFARALPHLSSGELQWRFRMVVVVITFHRIALFHTYRSPEASPKTEVDLRAWLTAVLTAALRAPAAEMT